VVSDSTQPAGGGDNDDTLIRLARDFYSGEPPAPQGDTGAATSSRPTLAERIMHRLPAPPEKAEARAEYEAKQAEREAELERAREDLRRQDEAAAEAKQQRATTGTAAAGTTAGATTAASGAARTAPASSAATTETAVRTTSRRTRRARLRLARVDPWSVMKTFFLFSIAGGIMFFTAVVVVYTVIDGSGLFDRVDQLVKDIFGQPSDDTPFQVREILGWERVMGVTALLACVNVVILTALATLGSFLYNLAATMLGGLEVTLAED